MIGFGNQTQNQKSVKYIGLMLSHVERKFFLLLCVRNWKMRGLNNIGVWKRAKKKVRYIWIKKGERRSVKGKRLRIIVTNKE